MSISRKRVLRQGADGNRCFRSSRNGDNLQLNQCAGKQIHFRQQFLRMFPASFYPTRDSLVKVFKEFDKNGIDIIGQIPISTGAWS